MNVLRRIGFALFAPVLALVVALLISAVVMAVLGVNPLKAFEVMLDFGETPSQQITALVVILNRAIPLFLSGLAVAVAFRMGLFNIGVEGQYRLATIIAAAVGAAVVLQRRMGIDPWRSGIAGLIAINLLLTFAIPGISIGGHIGGLIGGALAAFVVLEATIQRQPVLALLGSIALAVAFAFGGIWAANQAFSTGNPVLAF